MKKLKYLQADIIKWIIVILVLLFIPFGSVLLVAVAIILFYKKKIFNIDLLLLYFLLFFIQNVSGGTSGSGLDNVRFLLIFASFTSTVRQKLFSFKILFKKASYFGMLFSFLILHSILFSFETLNSLVELVSFLFLFLFAFKNTYFENLRERARVINNIEAMYIAVIFLSLFTFAVPAVAYARNGTGFQGVGNHPNSFGVVMAPFVGWTLVKLIQKFSFKDLVLMLLSFVLLYLSQSRTSMFSVILGLICIILVNREFRILFLRKGSLILLMTASLIIINFSSISSTVFAFLDKSKSGSIEESVLLSRGSLIENQTNNIDKNPFFGIGFKTPSNLMLEKSAFSLGKPYEKGNMLTAAVEEIGFVGFLILLITIIALLKPGKNRKTALFILPIIALCTTLGESTLFSIGGIGVLIWTFVFLLFHNGNLSHQKRNNSNLKQIPQVE